MKKVDKKKPCGFLVMILCLLTLWGSLTPAYAADTGWIEVKSQVPEGMKSYIILSLVNEDVQEEFDMAILPDNDFYAREEVPLGRYHVSAVWVFQDYRYTVKADVEEFVVGEEAATPIQLTVTAPEEETSTTTKPMGEEKAVEKPREEDFPLDISAFGTEEDDGEQEETVNPDSDTEEPTAEDSTEKESEAEMSVPARILILLLGTLIFAGVVVGVVYVVRRYF